MSEDNKAGGAVSGAQHTPGPWLLSEYKEDGFLTFTLEAGNGSCHGGNLLLDGVEIEGMSMAEQRATARLISAAPELLAAAEAQEAADAALPSSMVGPAHAHWQSLEDKAGKMRRAAIAKATGA